MRECTETVLLLGTRTVIPVVFDLSYRIPTVNKFTRSRADLSFMATHASKKAQPNRKYTYMNIKIWPTKYKEREVCRNCCAVDHSRHSARVLHYLFQCQGTTRG